MQTRAELYDLLDYDAYNELDRRLAGGEQEAATDD